MFNVYDPLEEYKEGQEYEISNGITESFMTDIKLDEFTEAQPSWCLRAGLNDAYFSGDRKAVV